MKIKQPKSGSISETAIIKNKQGYKEAYTLREKLLRDIDYEIRGYNVSSDKNQNIETSKKNKISFF